MIPHVFNLRAINSIAKIDAKDNFYSVEVITLVVSELEMTAQPQRTEDKNQGLSRART